MRKKSIFSLDPDQLERLFSVGTGDSDPIEEQKSQTNTSEVGKSREDPARKKDHPHREKEPLVNATASLVGMERPGSKIGRYKLLRVLGEGGMGMVYLAEQEGQIRRKVALKIIKPGMDSKRVIARFEAERQALALLDHPNIAQVYDAGTTETGRPYFVMEHVRGLPITDYCDRHKLTVEDRLRLFQQVCLAVHHAHQKGIIHRDIKPSNILISAENDRPIPKIIDFGVAKAISQPLTERTLFTEDSHLLGTPEYMSPEQADMSNEDIDTRSDIYSLGVLLYVLLAGMLPYDSKTFRQGGAEHIRRVIRETDLKTPSTRLSKLGEEAQKVAQSRRTEIASLTKTLHKELEWIPLKAMRKERAERYRSASELADDIENYLNGAPLIAGPPSTIYRLKKFTHRNRAMVTGIAAVLIVLIMGMVGIAIFAIKAEQRRVEAQLISDFLRDDVINSAHMVKGRDATVIDVLNFAVEKLDEGRFRDQPLIEAEIRNTLSSTYFRLGNFMAAAQHRKRTYGIYLEQLGEEHGLTRAAMNLLAVCYDHGGRYREAEPLYEQAIEKALREKSRVYTDRVSAWKCNLASTYKWLGRYEEAEELLRTMLESDEWDRDVWPKSERMAQYGHQLADIYREQGRYDEAEQMYLVTLENKSIRYPAHCTVVTLNGLARLRLAQKRYMEAEDLFTKGIEIGNRELPGKGHPNTLRNVNGLGVLRTKQGEFAEAESLFKEALEGQELKLGRDHPETLETKNDLAVLYKEQGLYEKAEKLLLEAVKGRRLKLGDTHPHTIESVKNLIDLYEAWNKPEKANQWRAKVPKNSF